jgi:hypothetical protein
VWGSSSTRIAMGIAPNSQIILVTVRRLGSIKMTSANKSKLEISYKIAAIISAAVAASSLMIAAMTYQNNSELQKQTITNQIFRDYLKLCLEYPEFAGGVALAEDSVTGQPQGKYLDFADYAMYSGETILALNVADSAWIGTVRSIIVTHRNYVLSKEFPWGNYSQEMISLIKKTIPESAIAR